MSIRFNPIMADRPTNETIERNVACMVNCVVYVVISPFVTLPFLNSSDYSMHDGPGDINS